MGILERWTKRKTKDQLTATNNPSTLPQGQSSGQGDSAVLEVEAKDVEVTEKKPATVKKIKLSSQALYSVIVKPLVSEKSARMETNGIYTFVVDSKANKFMVADAIKQIYGVKVEKVRISNLQGKWVRFGRQTGRRRDWKKAMVLLPKGKTLSIHEGV